MTLNQVYSDISKRYISLLEKKEGEFQIVRENIGKEHIIKMLSQIVKNKEMSLDKKARWFGFIQGVLFVNNIISVKEERNLTRPLFHAAYERRGDSTDTISV